MSLFGSSHMNPALSVSMSHPTSTVRLNKVERVLRKLNIS